MSTRLFNILIALAVNAIFGVCDPTHANAATTPARATQEPYSEVKDIFFGKVLYNFFQRKYFSATTHILLAEDRNKLEFHKDEAQLMLGGLYLTFGMFNDAENIFKTMVEKITDRRLRNAAWFNLGQVFYEKGELAHAQSALEKIDGYLPGEYQEKRLLLLAGTYLGQKMYADAIRTLEQLKSKSLLSQYGLYNLGVALVRLDRFDDGRKILERIGQMQTTDPELLALRDKTNLALGYAMLRAGHPNAAAETFKRIHLNGPYSNQAIYGLGQAQADLRQPEEAIRYWTELESRSTRGAAVLETRLAVGQGFFQLKAYKQSLDTLTDAIEMYQNQIAQLDTDIAQVKASDLLLSMLNKDLVVDETMSGWKPSDIPDALRQHFITQMLASHQFNQALNNYHDLRYFEAHLRKWQGDMHTFDLILQVRKKAFETRLPDIVATSEKLIATNPRARYDALAEEVDDIMLNDDPMRLAKTDELPMLKRLQATETRVKAVEPVLPAFRYEALRDKFELLKGLVQWRIMTEYEPRLYDAQKGLRVVDRQLKRMEQRAQSLKLAQQNAPQDFANFGQRITELKDRVDQLLSRVEEAKQAQEQAMKQQAIDRMEQQKQRLQRYIAQARAIVAQIYDISLGQEDGGAPSRAAPAAAPPQ